MRKYLLTSWLLVLVPFVGWADQGVWGVHPAPTRLGGSGSQDSGYPGGMSGSQSDWVFVPLQWDNESTNGVEVDVCSGYSSGGFPQYAVFPACGLGLPGWIWCPPGALLTVWWPGDNLDYTQLSLDTSGSTLNVVTLCGYGTPQGNLGQMSGGGPSWVVNLPFSRAGVGTNFPGFFIQGLCFGLGAGGLWAAIVLVRRGVQTTSGRD
jgi:hypothetical protein